MLKNISTKFLILQTILCHMLITCEVSHFWESVRMWAYFSNKPYYLEIPINL